MRICSVVFKKNDYSVYFINILEKIFVVIHLLQTEVYTGAKPVIGPNSVIPEINVRVRTQNCEIMLKSVSVGRVLATRTFHLRFVQRLMNTAAK